MVDPLLLPVGVCDGVCDDVPVPLPVADPVPLTDELTVDVVESVPVLLLLTEDRKSVV